jgi:hypothetical protein
VTRQGWRCLAIAWLVIAAGWSAVNAATHLQVVSRWRDRPIAIDGRQDDWGSSGLTPFGEEPVSIDVMNDADFLYVRLTASDAAVRNEILRRGLIIWFDPEGGTKKHFGIEYPVAEVGSFGEGRHGRYGGAPTPEGNSGTERPRGGAGEYEPPDRLEVHGPGKDDVRSLTLDHAAGIEAAVRVDQGSVVYELKVPLAKSDDRQYAIETAQGKTIGVGLETPKVQRPAESEQGGFGGGMGHGGGMGRGGGMGGHGGGMHRSPDAGGGGGYETPKPLKGWATIALAKGV